MGQRNFVPLWLGQPCFCPIVVGTTRSQWDSATCPFGLSHVYLLDFAWVIEKWDKKGGIPIIEMRSRYVNFDPEGSRPLGAVLSMFPKHVARSKENAA